MAAHYTIAADIFTVQFDHTWMADLSFIELEDGGHRVSMQASSLRGHHYDRG